MLHHKLRINRVWMKFIKGQLQAAFSKWRAGHVKLIQMEYSNVLDVTMQTQKLHQSRVIGHNERVAVKAARHITQRK